MSADITFGYLALTLAAVALAAMLGSYAAKNEQQAQDLLACETLSALGFTYEGIENE